MEYGEVVLTDGIDIAAHAEEALGAGLGANAARYLLADLEHAQDLLRVVVGEGDTEVAEEGEHSLLVTLHAIQEVEGLGFFGPTPAPNRRGRGRWIGGVALREETLVSLKPRGAFGVGEASASQRLELIDARVHVQQELAHLAGPVLVKVFKKEGQLPQDVGVAQAVAARQVEVGGKAVVDEAAIETGEDAEVFDGFAALAGVESVPGQELGPQAVDPVELALDAQSRLVAVKDIGARQERLDLRLEGLQIVGGRGFGALDGLLADGLAEDVGAELTEALRGDEILVAQISQAGEPASPILYGSGDIRREGRGDVDIAGGAVLGFAARYSVTRNSLRGRSKT